MGQFDRLKKSIFTVYVNIGVIAMGILAALVFFTVVMRYCFSLSWKQLSEFIVTLFTFTTFWGIGVCILTEEHVIIDMLYNKYPPMLKKIMSIFNYSVVFVVLGFFSMYAVEYTKMAGVQISLGMEIPMYYMYGIMPICGVIAMICAVIKIIEFIKRPASAFDKTQKDLPTPEGGNE